MSKFGWTMLGLQIALAIARVIRREQREREAMELAQQAATASDFGAPTEGESGLETKLEADNPGVAALSQLTLTGGNGLMRESSPAAASGKFERPRRARRTRLEPASETEANEAMTEGQGASILQIGGAVMLTGGSVVHLGGDARCSIEDACIVAEAPVPETVEVAQPVAAEAAAPPVAVPVRAPMKPPRAAVSGRVWRRVLSRAAITCPCSTCSGLLLLFKHVSRGDASPLATRAGAPPKALAAGSSELMKVG